MSEYIKVVGLDPSLSNFGMAKGRLHVNSLEFELADLHLSSPKSLKEKSVRKNSDDLIRSKILYTNLTQFIADTDLVIVEVPVGSQSARAMASYGICIGLLSSIVKPMIQVTPSAVKLAATNSKTASKAEMINWAVNKHPDAPWLTRKVKGNTTYTNANEHLADALAAIYAGTATAELQAMLALRK